MRKNFFLIVFALSSCLVFGQDVTNVDPAQVSDAQLQEAVEKAQAQGYSQQQIESLARLRGMSESQISAMRARISKVQEASGSSELTESQLREEFSAEELEFLNESDVISNDTGVNDLEGQIFGNHIFNKRNLNFSPTSNIPTPANYVLGAGDELIIDIWGASEKTYQLVINPEGNVKIPFVGPVYISGLTIDAATDKLLSRLEKIYSGLSSKSGKKNTYAQVSLGRIRSIKVNIIGEVRQPGTYLVSSLSTILHALYLSNGIGVNGSFRKVHLFRDSKKIVEFDLYDFLLNGDLTRNLVLEDQDIISVPTYESRVEIEGQVKRPKIYELKDNETLADLIEYAGGPTDEAYLNLVKIKRKTDYSKRIITINDKEFHSVRLESGDLVTIAQILDAFENRVSIDGAVWRPGNYEYTPGMTLLQLMEKAEGLTSDAFLGRGQIVRHNDDLSKRNITFNIQSVLDKTDNIILEPEDVVVIKSKFDLQADFILTVRGPVKRPGVFPFKDSLTVEDLIYQAGGFLESAATSWVEVSRRIDTDEATTRTADIFLFEIDKDLSLENKASNFILEPYDVVLVKASSNYRRQKVVKIEGEVSRPGYYSLESEADKITDIIERAGGFTSFAYPKGATLIRDVNYEEDGVTGVSLGREFRIETLRTLIRRDESIDGGLIAREGVGLELEKAIQSPESSYNIILRDGDVISIPKELETVGIRGEVFYPTQVRYNTRNSFRKYISLAGGLSENAKISKSFVVYPNGRAEKTKRFLFFRNFPRIEPGSNIIIPEKPEKRGETSIQEIVGLTSSIAALALIIDRLTE